MLYTSQLLLYDLASPRYNGCWLVRFHKQRGSDILSELGDEDIFWFREFIRYWHEILALAARYLRNLLLSPRIATAFKQYSGNRPVNRQISDGCQGGLYSS
jgi:hypothetical protein